jgi:hypothetical protein
MLPVQSFPAEILLLALVVGLALLALRAVRRRRAFVGTPGAPGTVALPAADLPRLDTQQRVTATLHRTFPDRAQGVWLAAATVGKLRLTFCPTDYATASERYQKLLGQPADVALFGLATLAPGGVEAMKDQIKDIDKVEITPDLVRLVATGEFANDHVVIGRVLSTRDEQWEEMALTVYRTEVVRRPELTLVIDLAVARDAGGQPAAPFAPGSMVHGSARLFGFLAAAG